MSTRLLFALIAVLAAATGGLLWWSQRAPAAPQAQVAPAALYAATFVDADGQRQPLGRFQGQVLLVNFWATWCAPCREEMPAFVRIQERWGPKGVQLLGLSSEAPEKAQAFGRELKVNYPLWTGGEEVAELSRRLGNALGVLPHSALIGRDGRLAAMKVGPYTEDELDRLLTQIVAKSSELR